MLFTPCYAVMLRFGCFLSSQVLTTNSFLSQDGFILYSLIHSSFLVTSGLACIQAVVGIHPFHAHLHSVVCYYIPSILNPPDHGSITIRYGAYPGESHTLVKIL